MIIIILFSLFCAYILYELYWKRRNLPPGPTPYPFVGNLPELEKYEPGYEAFQLWGKKFGPIFTFWMGDLPMVVFNDYRTTKKYILDQGDKFTDRMQFKAFLMYRGGDYGISETSGELWREQRRFALHTLRDFGMGKNIMEERVLTEVDFLLQKLSTNGDQPTQMAFDIAVGSVINSVIFGNRFDKERVEEFLKVKKCLATQNMEGSTVCGSLILVYPFLRFFPVFSEYWKRFWRHRGEILGFFQKQIDLKKRELENDVMGSDCFVECFLNERIKYANLPDFGNYSDLQLLNVVFDMWAAGIETTANTLSWGIVYLLNHPDVMAKVLEELDREIIDKRMITMEDKNRLIYLNATICETQRLANMIPLSLARKTTEDVYVDRFFLPKGTLVLNQISSVLYDEDVFPDPYRFYPERFLTEEGTLKRYDEFIPFSLGKRKCLGEGLAKMELFLFMANILNKFEVNHQNEFHLVNNARDGFWNNGSIYVSFLVIHFFQLQFHRFQIRCSNKPSMKKSFGLTMQPQPFSCEFVERKR